MPAAITASTDTPGTALATTAPQLPAAAAKAPEADRQRALVRVQARALDTLINDAGEVGATRARLDSELEALRAYLGELNDNVGRLRTQLREIEIRPRRRWRRGLPIRSRAWTSIRSSSTASRGSRN